MLAEISGCMFTLACNYNPNANVNDGSCIIPANCEVCDGSDINDAYGAQCDCDGKTFDAIGECGGLCSEDADNDGICDTEDDCLQLIDGTPCSFKYGELGYDPLCVWLRPCNYNPNANIAGICA